MDNQTQNKTQNSRQQPMQINVRMQQNAHTSQPIYANFTTVQNAQKIIIVDFGFVDPQLIATLNRMARTGEKTPDTIEATMSCRMALNLETAHQLFVQLGQLFPNPNKSESKAPPEQQSETPATNLSASTTTVEEKITSKEDQRGFKFPWSS